MKFIIEKVVENLCDLLIELAEFGSMYMCWNFVGEEELPQELKSDEF